MAKASSLFPSLAMLTLIVGCATRQQAHLWISDNKIRRTVIDDALRRYPLGPDENVRVTELGQSESASHHLAQVRFSEPWHIHRFHDLTVLIYRGTGILQVGTNELAVAAGDILFVPRGLPHRMINQSQRPSVAVVVFTPALKEKDFEPIDHENR